jgi:hypothetical protein
MTSINTRGGTHGGENIHLFKLVDLMGAGLSSFIIPILTRRHLFN